MMATYSSRFAQLAMTLVLVLAVPTLALADPVPNSGRSTVTHTPPPGYRLSSERAAPEDSWWQTAGRQRLNYVELGLGMQTLAGNSGAPESTSFLDITALGRITAGHWILPWLAAEGRLGIGGGTDSGLFSKDEISRVLWDVQGGIRMAMPTYITPVFAAHLGYSYIDQSWTMFDAGTTLHGTDSIHALTIGSELGLQFNYKAFSFTTVAYVTTPLFGSFDRSGDSPDDEPLHEVSARDARYGGEVRVGVRF